ncbi:MAG: hypothetical protein GY854_06110, partial [Deltaproteobacteria bacterium]|nr:hypothetical protein [Deltaproteobacteria bacterium]
MSSCDLCQVFLDGRLDAEDEEAFFLHLNSCPECRAEVEQWKNVESIIETELVEDALRRKPTSAATDRLIERQRETRGLASRRIAPSVHWALVAAAAVAMGILAFVFMRGDRTVQAPMRPVDRTVAAPSQATTSIPLNVRVFNSENPSEDSFAESVGVLLDAPKGGRLVARTDRDHLGLAPSSRVRVLALHESTTRLELERGTVACSVASRSGEGEFIIEVGKVSVRVVGTRFSVARADDESVYVHVAEGAVAVTGNGVHARIVKAGFFLRISGIDKEPESGRLDNEALTRMEGLLSEAVSSSEMRATIADASVIVEGDSRQRRNIIRGESNRSSQGNSLSVIPANEKGNPLEVWQRWVIEGKLDDAEKALRPYVGLKPRDHR